MPGYSLLKRLQAEEIILPHLELSLQAENWPDSYTITIDSTPYTGNHDGYFHASSDWKMGKLYLYYKVHPVHKYAKKPEKRSLSSNMTLAMGSAIHGVIQTQLKMVGLLKDEDIEVPFRNDAEKVRGNCDGIVSLPGTAERLIFELKTQNSRAYNFQDEPKEAWYGQCQIYMHEFGLKRAVMVIAESGYPYRMREFIIEYDPEFIRKIYDKFRAVLEAVEEDKPPARPCCSWESPEMKKCAFREICWFAQGGEASEEAKDAVPDV